MKRIPLFEEKLPPTPLYRCKEDYGGNEVYLKRDDLLPFSFGGNKVRKAQKFYREIVEKQADCLVTYGSSSSNHCRIISNMAALLGIPCHLISPEENAHETANSRIIRRLKATVEYCPVDRVKETIDNRLSRLKERGNPYFIMGGGHGNPGTEGYLDAYRELLVQEEERGIDFDYIFHASGTGATQAGLVVGQLLEGREAQEIVGISIARMEEPGRRVVCDSVKDYLEFLCQKQLLAPAVKEDLLQKMDKKVIFTDKYRLKGYGDYNKEIAETVAEAERQEGVAMDTTYVGKAFWGMKRFLAEQGIEKKKVLFWHTGGTPLYFNHLEKG